MKALEPDARGRVMQLVHALGVEPDHLLRSAAPSPGEARKLRLALGLGRHAAGSVVCVGSTGRASKHHNSSRAVWRRGQLHLASGRPGAHG